MKLSENSIRSSIQEMILDQHALGKAPRDSKRLLEYIAGEYHGKAKSEMWGFSRKQFAKSESWLVGDIDAGTVTIGGEEMSCHAAMTKGYERSPASHMRGKSIDISNTGNIKDMLLQLREKGASISKLGILDETRVSPADITYGGATGKKRSQGAHWHLTLKSSTAGLLNASFYTGIMNVACQLIQAKFCKNASPCPGKTKTPSHPISGYSGMIIDRQFLPELIKGLNQVKDWPSPETSMEELLLAIGALVVTENSFTPITITDGDRSASEQAALVMKNWGTVRDEHGVPEAKKYLVSTYCGGTESGCKIANIPINDLHSAFQGIPVVVD